MRLRSFIVVVALLSSFASRASAQATKPATAPGTAPAVAADTTTPKGTLKLLSTAMEQGDAEAMRRLMLAADSVEQRMVAAQVAQAEAFARFRQALVATFGQPALDELLGAAPSAEARNAVFDAAPQTLDGDRATVTVEADQYELRKVDGQWMLSFATMAKSLEPGVLDESLRQMTVRSDVMKEVATEIAEGKYQNTDEVGQAIQGKMLTALMREAAATQGAATQPRN